MQNQQMKSTERLRRLDALIEMRADGEISKAVFSAKVDDTRSKLDSAEAALRGAKAALAAGDPGRIHSRAVGAVRALLDGTKRLSVAQRRQVLLSVVEQVDVTVRKNVDWHQKRGKDCRLAEASGPRWEIEEVMLNLMISAENDAQNLTSEALVRDHYKGTTSSNSVQVRVRDYKLEEEQIAVDHLDSSGFPVLFHRGQEHRDFLRAELGDVQFF